MSKWFPEEETMHAGALKMHSYYLFQMLHVMVLQMTNPREILKSVL